MDLPRGVPSGLRRASEILEGVEGIGIVQLQAMDVIRHEVVTRIVEAYERHERKEEERKQ